MLKVYGSRLCGDCIDCIEAFDRFGIEYEFLDFSEDLRYLKTFLQLRDAESAFNEIRGTDMIGIPCILDPNGNVSLDWNSYVSQD